MFGLASLLWSHSSPRPCALRSWFWAPSRSHSESKRGLSESVACRCDLGPASALSPHCRVHSASCLQPSAFSLLQPAESLGDSACSTWSAYVGVNPWLSTAYFPGRKSCQWQAFPTFNAPSLNLFHLGERQCGLLPCLHSLQMDDPW